MAMLQQRLTTAVARALRQRNDLAVAAPGLAPGSLPDVLGAQPREAGEAAQAGEEKKGWRRERKGVGSGGREPATHSLEPGSNLQELPLLNMMIFQNKPMHSHQSEQCVILGHEGGPSSENSGREGRVYTAKTQNIGGKYR